MIDTHFHIGVMPHEYLHILGLCELDTVIVPSDQMIPDFSTLEMDFGIFNLFLAITYPMWGLPVTQMDEGLKLMEEYINHPRVVGVGEAGMDTITVEHEEVVFKAMVDFAKEHDVPIIVHSPPPRHSPFQGREKENYDKRKVMDRIIEILGKSGIDPNKVILDHINKETIKPALDYGAWLGMSCCLDKLSATDVVEMYQEYGPDRLIVNSEWGYSGGGNRSVPKVVVDMKAANAPVEDIQKIVFDNAKTLFNLPI
jgi:predicted metal-dependent TIM-barrel fold hydrolase